VKSLFLLRHAKAELGADRDVDRALNPLGRRAALAMGEELRRLGLAADHILASPAIRVAETLALLADGYGGRMPIDYREDLYLASPETLLAHIQAVDDEHESLLIVGHNPGLQHLALILAAEGELRARIIVKYPTGALTEIELPVERWCDVDEGRGRIARFLRPRDLGVENAED